MRSRSDAAQAGHRLPEAFTGSLAEDADSSDASLFLAEHRSVFLSPPPRSGIRASGASGLRGNALRRRKTPGRTPSQITPEIQLGFSLAPEQSSWHARPATRGGSRAESAAIWLRLLLRPTRMEPNRQDGSRLALRCERAPASIGAAPRSGRRVRPSSSRRTLP